MEENNKKELTVSEAKQAKEKLEETLKNIIAEYETNTGLTVNQIAYKRDDVPNPCSFSGGWVTRRNIIVKIEL